jgi:Ser/Thr protein kinase RdoA (MazF antagonist)
MPSGTLPPAQRNRLDEVLSGRLGVEAVRDVARHPWRHGYADSRPGPSANPPITLLRSKFKPSRKLTAYYLRDGAAAVPQHLAVSWHAAPQAERDGDLTVLAFPTDPAMPQLARLADPAYLHRLVTRLGGSSAGDPGGAGGMLEVTPIRYRPGQRHVLHVTAEQGGRGVIVKLDKHRSGPLATSVARALMPLLAQRCPGVSVAAPLGFSEPDAAALWHVAPGTALSQRLGASVSDAAASVGLVGRAIRVIHDEAGTALSAPLRDRLPVHDAANEAASTLRAGEHIGALLPDVGRRYADLVAAAVRALGRTPSGPASTLHGDLKSDNLLVHGASLRILDLDRVCVGESALDLGKLLADLLWWGGGHGAARRLQSALRAGYGTVPSETWARAALLSALFQLKFAARRCVIHDPRWSTRVRAQVDLAAATLASAGAS